MGTEQRARLLARRETVEVHGVRDRHDPPQRQGGQDPFEMSSDGDDEVHLAEGVDLAAGQSIQVALDDLLKRTAPLNERRRRNPVSPG